MRQSVCTKKDLAIPEVTLSVFPAQPMPKAPRQHWELRMILKFVSFKARYDSSISAVTERFRKRELNDVVLALPLCDNAVIIWLFILA